jgi:hypothetical protein
MNFHDTSGMYEAIAKWVESQDVEIDWTTLMNCSWWIGPKDWVPPPKWSMPPPFPRQLSTLLVTKLIFAQESEGLQIPPMLTNPADIELGAINEKLTPRLGGEGIDPPPAAGAPTDPVQWEKFLGQLGEVIIQKTTLYVISEEDRRALVRMAVLEEELERRRVEDNRERVRRQDRGEAVGYVSRKAIPTLVDRAKRGSLEAIGELERRGWEEVEISEWRVKAKRKAAVLREVAVERMKARGKIFNRELKVEEKEESLVKKAERGTEKGGRGSSEGVPVPREEHGIERELEVKRVGPNPRILVCRYKELASERECLVAVKSVKNFVKGMRLRMREPVNEAEYREPWVYAGVLPRYRGRW